MSAAVYLFACFMDANCSARNPRPYLDERPSKEKRITKKVIKQQQTSCGLFFYFFPQIIWWSWRRDPTGHGLLYNNSFPFFLLTGNERTRFSCCSCVEFYCFRFFTFFFLKRRKFFGNFSNCLSSPLECTTIQDLSPALKKFIFITRTVA